MFSTTGEIANIVELVSLSRKNHATLIVDDAHAIGVLGKTGAGSAEYFGLSSKEIDVRVCSLGKAFACYGAMVVGEHRVIEMLIQFARTYCYSTYTTHVIGTR